MSVRRFLLVTVASVAAGLTVTACSSGGSSTIAARPLGSPPSANAASPSKDAPVRPGGGAFCDVVKTSQDTMRPLAQDIITKPENTKDAFTGIVNGWKTMAAAAPPELRDDLRVIVDAWSRAGDQAAKEGWDALALTRAIAQQLDDKSFQKAYEHWAGYVRDTCGIDPFQGLD